MRAGRGNASYLAGSLALVLVGFSWMAAAAQQVSAGDAAQQQQRLELLRKRISKVQAHLRGARGQQSQLNQQLEASELRIGDMARHLRVLDGRLQRQQQRLDSLKAAEQQQLDALAQQRAALRQQIRAAYIMGRQEKLKLLLNQQDPALVSRMLTFYQYLNQARMARMQDIQNRLHKLEQTRAQIASERNRLLALRDQRTQQKQALEQEQTARRKLVAALGQQISDQDQKLTRLRGDAAQLQSLLSDLRKALNNIPAKPAGGRKFSQLRGRLDWPVRGRIVHAFGSPKIGALRWDGVLIRAPEGNEVRAIYAGRVVFADWLRGFGLLLIIDHGNGYMSLYGHNQSLFKEVGDWVDAGEQIAAVGDTGGRTEAGEYFAIRKNGKAVNPARWCRKPRHGKVG